MNLSWDLRLRGQLSAGLPALPPTTLEDTLSTI